MDVPDDRRPIVVYRERLGNASEPFIAAQAERLKRHVAHYLAIRAPAGDITHPERVLAWSDLPVGAARRYAWKRWGFAPSTVRAFRRLAPVLVHAHFGRDAVQLLPLVDRTRTPLVVTFHGHDATRLDADLARGPYSDRLYLQRRGRLASSAAKVLTVSAFLRDRLLERGFPEGTLEVHYIGIDVDAIAAHGRSQRDDGLVVFVGRLVDQKGVADLLEAIDRVHGARVVIVGDGPLRAELEARAATMTNPVSFTGAAAPEEVWSWMGRAAVVAVPSRATHDGRAEGFGLVAAEAQAAGAVVVATSTGGLPEAIAPTMQDLQVPHRDPEALAAAIDRALGLDGATRTERIEPAVDWLRAHRNLTTQNARLEDIYEAVAPR